MRLFLSVICAMIFLSVCGWAQEDNISSAVSSLQSVLSNLKDSVQQLDVDNQQLVSRDNAIKEQVLHLQAQLQRLQGDNDLLNKAAGKLKISTPRRDEQISRLEEENTGLDDQIKRSKSSNASMQQSLNEGYQEDQKLLLELKTLSNVQPVPVLETPQEKAAAHLQKEKLGLIKMIYESQQRQETLHQSIMQMQQSTSSLPAAGALARQQLLKEQIKDLEDQIAAYPPQKPSAGSNFSNQWEDAQMSEFQGELRSLEQNYVQLKNLMAQMSKKAQSIKLTTSQHEEEEKLQGSLNDLNHQGASLRADLDELRSQMVELDKRKSRLEDMVQHLP